SRGYRYSGDVRGLDVDHRSLRRSALLIATQQLPDPLNDVLDVLGLLLFGHVPQPILDVVLVVMTVDKHAKFFTNQLGGANCRAKLTLCSGLLAISQKHLQDIRLGEAPLLDRSCTSTDLHLLPLS